MKKILGLFLALFLVSAPLQAAVLPAGTAVNVHSVQEIDADEVKAGDIVSFIVTHPVKYNDKVVIKAGTEVKAQVTKRKNNCILGIPGTLEIGNFKIYKTDGEFLGLRGTVIDKGEQRYWANIGWIMVFPLLFIKGDDGKIPMNLDYILYTVDDISL